VPYRVIIDVVSNLQLRVKVRIPEEFGTVRHCMKNMEQCRRPVRYSNPGLTFLISKANFLAEKYPIA
jgi:hypothetical protein